MTLQEFSDQFDVLVNSYTRFRDFDNKEPKDTIEFNEYEKSLYLTKAQEEVIRSLYNGRNPLSESFEQTEELRRYLSNLIEEAELSPLTNSSGKPLGVAGSNSYFFTLPNHVWFITYEAVLVSGGKCEETTSIEVYPTKQDEYHKIKKNPFRGANDRRALRLDLSENNVEIICKYTVDKYYIRYIKMLKPIVLEDMPNGVTIDGEQGATECEVHESLHQKILELAVMTALQNKGIWIQSQNKEQSK